MRRSFSDPVFRTCIPSPCAIEDLETNGADAAEADAAEADGRSDRPSDGDRRNDSDMTQEPPAKARRMEPLS